MKWIKGIVLFTLSIVLSGPAYPAASPQQRHLTLMVVPARYNVLQVAFDAASLAPLVLVSYQGEASTENPLLHAWNGSEWLYVSMEDFEQGHFLQVSPAEAILVGDEKLLPPVLVSAVAGWCPKTMTIPTTDTTALLNDLGGHLSFKPGDWKWIAARYNMNLEDLNAGRRAESWYDQPGYRDEMTPRLESLPKRRYERFSSSGASGPAVSEPMPVPVDVPPANVMPESQEAPAPAEKTPSAEKAKSYPEQAEVTLPPAEGPAESEPAESPIK